MRAFETRTVALLVGPKDGCGVLNEDCTTVSVVDAGAGEYVELSQVHLHKDARVGISKTEWPAVKEAIERLLEGCLE